MRKTKTTNKGEKIGGGRGGGRGAGWEDSRRKAKE